MRLVPETSALSPELRGLYTPILTERARSGKPAAGDMRVAAARYGERGQFLPRPGELDIMAAWRGAPSRNRKRGITRIMLTRLVWRILVPGLMLFLAGCNALVASDSVATIDADLTMYASEGDMIRAAATAESNMALETVVAASTRVAELSVVNAALGATLRANYTGTPELEAVVVSAEDMGSSLEDDMMNDATAGQQPAEEMTVSSLATAAGIDANSGCSSGTVRQFSQSVPEIFVTARVTALRAGADFQVSWFRGSALVYDFGWRSPYSKPFECIWFYATPEDFAFTPGSYSASLSVDGVELGSATFDILAN